MNPKSEDRKTGAFPGKTRGFGSTLFASCLFSIAATAAEDPAKVVTMPNMTFDELASIRIVTVSRREEDWFTSAASVHVVTAEEIRRSGVTSLADAVRLAPSADVGFVNSRTFAATIRGFNGLGATKVLPLVDGRSVYSLRASGTIWDIRDIPLEEVSRIEVISGPSGTLWGANAVNGVINVISLGAQDTLGTMLSAGGGTFEQAHFYARHGFNVGETAWMRVYARASQRGDSEPVNIADANDAWRQFRTGLRFDARPDESREFKVTSDFFANEGDQIVRGKYDIARSVGGHFLATGNFQLEGGKTLGLRAYYDGFRRDSGGNNSEANTFDVESQLDLPLGDRHLLTVGANYRLSGLHDQVDPAPGFISAFQPESRWFNQGGLFLQDQIDLVPEKLRLTAGVKAEYNDFSGWEPLPSVRMAWTPTKRHTFWGAVSRAAKIPSRQENDLTSAMVAFGSTFITDPEQGLTPEILWAYEAGWRAQPIDKVTISVSGFYNHYDDLISAVAQAAPPLTSVTR